MAAKKTAKKAPEAAPKPAKKAAKKAAKAPKKQAAPAEKPAKKLASKKSATKAGKNSAPPEKVVLTPDQIARAAYLNYRRRVEQGLPGDTHEDWLEAERQNRAAD